MPGLVQAAPDGVTAQQALAVGQSTTAAIWVSYSPTELPYYPVRITTVVRSGGAADEAPLSSHDCYVYFTPYGTAEVWDGADYSRLRRSWLIGDESTAPARVSIDRSLIPVSNIGPHEEAGPQDYIGMEFVEGLAYAVPMRYPSAMNSETAASPDPQAAKGTGMKPTADNCGWGLRRYRGRIENVRIFTMHARDRDGLRVPIALKNARVRIMRDVDIGTDITLKEVYTDDEGFVTQYGSRVVEFDHCSINQNAIVVYLSVEMVDQPEKVRLKRAWGWYSWTRVITNTQRLNYNNSNRQTLNFGNPAGANRELSLDPNDGGRSFTWVKWSKQLLEQELGSAANFSSTLGIKILDPGEGAHYDRFTRNICIAYDLQLSEETTMHEFGHFAMHEMQRGNWLSETGGIHYLERNNKHPNTTITEGFANGLAYIMDEMTRSVLDQESGADERGGRSHPRRRTQLYLAVDTGLPRNMDLNHPFVSEDTFARILLDLWDGPTNYARFGNTLNNFEYNDGGMDNFEMPLVELFRPVYTSLTSDLVRYYNRLLQENTAANVDRNVQMRNLWHFNFSETNYNPADFTILGTDEISATSTVTHDRDEYGWFSNSFNGTSTYAYTYFGTDVTALGGPLGSYNLTTYLLDSYDTAGRHIGRETVNANGAVLSDNLTVQNGAGLYLHGSPQPCSFRQPPPYLRQYTKRTDHLNIDVTGQARVVVQQDSRVEVGSVSPYQTAVVNLHSGTLLSIEAGGELRVQAGSTLSFESGATLLVRNGGSVTIDGALFIRSGGHICVEDGGIVTLTATSTLDVDAGAQMGPFPGLGLSATTCTNNVAACGTVNIRHSGVTNTGGGNEALSFDGDDVVSIPNTNSYVNNLGQQFAIEAYIRPTSLVASDGQTIFSNRRTNLAKTHELEGVLFTLLDGYLLLQLDGVNFGYQQPSMRFPTDGGGHHVAVSRDGTNQLRFFIDGQRVAYSPTTVRGAYSGGPLRLGADDSNGFGLWEFYSGLIGEVRVWNSSRTDDQIRENLTTKLAAPQYGLVLYYDMQDPTGQQVGDGSAHSLPLVPGVLGSNATIASDDPTWVSKCGLPGTVRGNFRGTGPTTTKAPKRGGLTHTSVADTMGHVAGGLPHGMAKTARQSLPSLHVIPNPASGSATLHFVQPAAGPVRVRILDLAGTQRAEALPATSVAAGNHTVALPLRGLPPGLYLVTVEHTGGREFTRLQVE